MAAQLSDKANWLGRYLATERSYDATLIQTLKDAAEDLHGKLVALPDKDIASVAEKRMRYTRNMSAIDAALKTLFGVVRSGIKDGREDAAGAAAQAKLYEDNKFLERLFPDVQQRQSYADSLDQTARRNIEAVMSRELETKLTLSQQVYKTQALSKGYVSNEINRALARGDGAKEIADAVRDMIRPDVPGGVSYAAMRLGRTEVHNAFHAQSRHEIEESPFTTRAEWNLSKTHQEIGCVCEEYADIRFFDKYDIPDCPHPQCRCYITGEQMEWEDFESALLAGKFDALKADSMEPAPTQAPTTKAAQPDGWTGHPVAKAAANQAVNTAIDSMFNKYSVSGKAMANMREGARNVQVKGYRGGLSAPGKKAILGSEVMPGVFVADTESVLYDMGRELTARTAYADPSAVSVYKAVDLTPAEKASLRKTPNISMPLSRFEANGTDAISIGDSGIGQNTNTMFVVQSGAKLASTGDSFAGLGQFTVQSVDDLEIQGKKMTVVRLKQFDTREFDADVPKGTAIREFEAVAAQPKPASRAPTSANTNEPTTLAGGTLTEPADDSIAAISHVPEGFSHTDDLAPAIDAAKSAQDIALILWKKYPDLDITHMTDAYIPDIKLAQEYGKAIDEMITKYPKALRYITNLDVGNSITSGNALAACQTYLGIWRSNIEVNAARMRTNWNTWKRNKEAGVKIGWHTPASDITPLRSTWVHEFGHLIDNSGAQQARKEVQRMFKDEMNASGTYAGTTERLQWLNANAPSRYSLNKAGTDSNPAELIAESFADVHLRGEGAHPMALKVVAILMKHAWSA